MRVKQLVRSDRKLTVRMIADELGLNRESGREILLHDLGMRKVVVFVVAHIYPPVTGKRQTLTCWTIRTLFITTTTS